MAGIRHANAADHRSGGPATPAPAMPDRMRTVAARLLDALENDVAGFDPSGPDVARTAATRGIDRIAFRLGTVGVRFRAGHPIPPGRFDELGTRERPSMTESAPGAH